MKKAIWLMVLLLAGTWSGGVWAHEDPGPVQKLTGEVVCLSCYLGHGAMGDIHASCGKQCIGKGLPAGLKVGDKLYLLVGQKHTMVNAKLSRHVGRQVVVTGQVHQQDGMSLMEVEKVEKK